MENDDEVKMLTINVLKQAKKVIEFLENIDNKDDDLNQSIDRLKEGFHLIAKSRIVK